MQPALLGRHSVGGVTRSMQPPEPENGENGLKTTPKRTYPKKKPHLCRFSSFCCVFLSVLAAPWPAVPLPLAFLRLSRPEPMLHCVYLYSSARAAHFYFFGVICNTYTRLKAGKRVSGVLNAACSISQVSTHRTVKRSE